MAAELLMCRKLKTNLPSGVARLSWLPGLSEVITRLCAKHVVDLERGSK